MERKLTLVLGASSKPERYSNKATLRLLYAGHPVVAVGLREGDIAGTPIVTTLPEGGPIDTVTMYMSAQNQEAWEQRILALRPKRIIFNPGAENERLSKLAADQGIEVVEGCTLVMLSVGTF